MTIGTLFRVLALGAVAVLYAAYSRIGRHPPPGRSALTPEQVRGLREAGFTTEEEWAEFERLRAEWDQKWLRGISAPGGDK